MHVIGEQRRFVSERKQLPLGLSGLYVFSPLFRRPPSPSIPFIPSLLPSITGLYKNIVEPPLFTMAMLLRPNAEPSHTFQSPVT